MICSLSNFGREAGTYVNNIHATQVLTTLLFLMVSYIHILPSCCNKTYNELRSTIRFS